MAYCTWCGEELENGARFCGACGVPIRPRSNSSTSFVRASSLPAVAAPSASPTTLSSTLGGTEEQGVFRRLFWTKGRIGRLEFWLFQVGALLVLIGAGLIGTKLETSKGIDATGPAMLIASALLFVPSWGVAFRRAHDLNRSRGFAILSIVPIVGLVVLLMLGFQGGTSGPNDYGMPNSGSILHRNA